jgi:hypothetical protein
LYLQNSGMQLFTCIFEKVAVDLHRLSLRHIRIEGSENALHNLNP